MDLRTIINAESTSTRQSSSLSPRQRSGQRQDSLQATAGGPAGVQRNDSSPDLYQQRPPLQPSHHSPGGATTHGAAHSPYQQQQHHQQQHTVSSALSSGPGRQPPHLQTVAPGSRESAAATGQPGGVSLSSPFTPQSAQFSQGRSHSSIHSATSPTSAHSLSYPAPPPPIHRDNSTGSSYPPSQHPQHAVPPLQQPQSYSPSQRYPSQPGTPSAAARQSGYFHHPSPQSARPLSSGREPQSAALGSPWPIPDVQKRDSGASPSVMSPAAQPSLSRHNSTASQQYQGPVLAQQSREPTFSASPKSISAHLKNQDSASGRNSVSQDHHHHHPGGRTDVGDTHWQANNATPSNLTSHPHDSGRPAPPPPPPPQPQPQPFHGPPTTPRPSVSSGLSPRTSTVSPHSRQTSIKPSSPGPMARQPTPATATNERIPAMQDTALPRPKKKRRKRYTEPPLFAQKAPRKSGAPPVIPTSHNAPQSKKPPRKSDSADNQPFSNKPGTPRSSQPVKENTNGPAVNGAIATTPTDGGPAQEPNESILGPWEPSIMGVIPHEELTKIVCDFLFQQVVMRKDIGAGPPGAALAGAGAILEIEAKLGQLVDKNRGGRLRLPVLTECVLSREDPSLRIAFESSMSLAQHRGLNNFLNDSVKSSMTPGSQRIPLSYAHKKERDSFYEIAPAALPPIVQHHLNPRHKPKVRVTTDQRTGNVLARIIKCRIADLDVYSPRTCLDWRISVNLEMNYDGDPTELIPATDAGPAGSRRGDRNKDRMSYRHLAYQIDLTQVATSESAPTNPQTDFDHELEVEISSAEVRRQGDLALNGDPSHRYEDLVKGFVDNVRVLARSVPEQ